MAPKTKSFFDGRCRPPAGSRFSQTEWTNSFSDKKISRPSADPEPTIIFCGAMDYSPNVNGLRWYFTHCDADTRRRIPKRRILIVGKSPVPEVESYADLPGVTVTGEVPDVRPYYQRAWLQMVPLLIGGGTRLKIAESLALGTPVVSTTIGAQGLALRHDEHLLLADTPADFSEMLARLLTSDVAEGETRGGGPKTHSAALHME